MLRILFLMFVLYLVYKIVFDFIIPVSKATTSVKTKINEMQEERLRQQQRTSPAAQKDAAKSKKDEDYIDFEEVK